MQRLKALKDIKSMLGECLDSHACRRQFRQMVDRTAQRRREHAFLVGAYKDALDSKVKIIAGPIATGDGLSTTLTNAEEKRMLALERKRGIRREDGILHIIILHTHPIHQNNGGYMVPSRTDVEIVSSSPLLSGIVVPVNLVTGESEALFFQPYSDSSHVNYGNLWERTESDENFADKMLSEAQKLEILRIVRLKKRAVPEISEREIRLILSKMEIVPAPEY